MLHSPEDIFVVYEWVDSGDRGITDDYALNSASAQPTIRATTEHTKDMNERRSDTSNLRPQHQRAIEEDRRLRANVERGGPKNLYDWRIAEVTEIDSLTLKYV